MPRAFIVLVCVAAVFCTFSLCKKPPVALHTPSTPAEPSGASTGLVDTSYSLQTSSTDPDSDYVKYRVAVSGSDTSAWSQWLVSGELYVFSVLFHEPGTFEIRVQAKDRDDSISGWSDAHQIIISARPNRPPVTPDSFTVVPIQLTTIVYQSRVFPVDPDSDAVECRWAWGDGDTSVWKGYARAPGAFWSPGHMYAAPGSYQVRVQARDTWGLTSGWSQPKAVVANEPDFPWRDARRFDLPFAAGGIVVHPSGDRYFIVGAGVGAASISVTGDTALGSVVIPGVSAQGTCPLALSPDGAFLYVVGYDCGRLWRIRTSDMTLTDSAAVGVSAYGVAVSPDGEHVYVTNFYGTLQVVRTSDMTVERSIGLEDGVRDVAVNPSGQHLYVLCFYNDTPKLYVIRTSDYTVETTFSMPIEGICVSPDGAYLYTGNYDNTIKVIRTSDHTLTTTVTLPASANYLAVTPDGRYLYLRGGFYEGCCVLRTSDNTVRAYIDADWDALDFAPDGQVAYGVHSTTALVVTR